MWTRPFGSLLRILEARNATIGAGTPEATACGSRWVCQRSEILARSTARSGTLPSSTPTAASMARSSVARGPVRADGPELISVNDLIPPPDPGPALWSPSSASRAISPPYECPSRCLAPVAWTSAPISEPRAEAE
jgi:hypothetical protein